MTKTPIAEHVQLAAKTALAVRKSQGHDLQPMLHLVGHDDQITIALLAVEGGGRDFAYAARQVILQQRPEHAVLMIEGWCARKDLDRDDPDGRAVIAGALRPSQLPPHKRGEQLTVIGESDTGETAQALYYLEPDGSSSELFGSWNLSAEDRAKGDGVVTHFYPMFLDQALVRSLSGEDLAVMEEMLGSREKLLHMANKAARKFLTSVGPGDLADYVRQFDALQKKAREDIGWRKGRA